jgi:Fe2+ transport system protein B
LNVNASVPLVVLVNKVDMINERSVSDELISEMIAPLGAPWLHTSAKTGEGVDEAFHLLGRLLNT